MKVSRGYTIRYPLYSPHLSPSNYYLLPNFKKWFGGKRFGSSDEVETNAYLREAGKYYLEGDKKLGKRGD